MATRAEFEALMQQRIEEGDYAKANRIRVEKLGLPPVQPPGPPDTFGQNVMDVGGEFASAANRATMQGLDFLTSPLQAIDNATGDRFPTFEGAHAQTPGASGGFMEAGTPRDMVRGAGGAAPAALGFLPVAGRNIASPAGAALDFMGLGTAQPQAAVAPFATSDYPTNFLQRFAHVDDAVPAASPFAPPVTARTPQMPSTQRVGRLIDQGSESVERAGKALDPYTGRVITDQGAKASMKQGLDDGLTSMVQEASPSTRDRLGKMLDIVDTGRKFKRETIHRPGDVIGDALLDRVRVVRSANRQAGEMIDTAASSLRSEQVDVSGPVSEFTRDLSDMGISLDVQPGNVSVGFDGSDIDDLDGPVKAITRMVKRMSSDNFNSAYDVHRLKRIIDETVTYGKSAEGLSGRTERIIKKLRAGIDGALDAKFPAYKQANDQYSETIRGLNELQSLAGKRADLTGPNADKDLGVLLRRILSNARSRVPIMDNVKEIDRIAKKYVEPGTDVGNYRGILANQESIPQSIDDDILTQTMFADELERIFGTHATTSLMGDMGKVMGHHAVDAAMTGGGSVWNTAGEAIHTGIDRMRGINKDNAMDALRRLLENK